MRELGVNPERLSASLKPLLWVRIFHTQVHKQLEICDKDQNKLLTGTSQVRWSREQSGMFQTTKVPTLAGVLCGQKTPIFQVRWQYTRSERGHNLSWLRPTLTTGISKCQSQRSYAPIIRLRQYRQNLSILQIYCTTWSAQLEGGLSVVSGFSGFTRAFGLKIKNQ